MALTTTPGYDFRAIDPKRDRLITDSQTGAVLGIETDQGVQMLNGVSDYTSCVGSCLTTVSGRNIIIPSNAQAVSVGGVTVSSGSITCIGELVAISY